jgi:hypothetical protein
MAHTRAAHTATTLPGGKVLIAGGLDGGGASVELFDPVTRSFADGPSMRLARVSHTATLLADGRVMIAGGYNGVALSSTEIYDPMTNAFVPGPEMLEPRMGHLAIVLADARILFVGGQTTALEFLKTAELFDPTTNQFVATGSMSVPRESHVGALLGDGTVLIAGGHMGRRENIQLYASAERYDPRTGLFSATGSMIRRRHKHSAIALADGRVLVTGGSDERDDRGQYRDAELFDPATGSFTAAREMNRTRYKHEGAMVLLGDGKVLVAGGAGIAEIFDPVSNGFGIVPSESELAGSFSAVARLADGSVLITGGYGNGTGSRSSAWLYMPAVASK